jgi:hypothetical protein
MDDTLLEKMTIRLVLRLIHEEIIKKSELKNPELIFRQNILKFEKMIKNYIAKNNLLNRDKLIKILAFYKMKNSQKYFHMRHKRQFLQLTKNGILFLANSGVNEISFDTFFINVIATFLEAAIC